MSGRSWRKSAAAARPRPDSVHQGGTAQAVPPFVILSIKEYTGVTYTLILVVCQNSILLHGIALVQIGLLLILNAEIEVLSGTGIIEILNHLSPYIVSYVLGKMRKNHNKGILHDFMLLSGNLNLFVVCNAKGGSNHHTSA